MSTVRCLFGAVRLVLLHPASPYGQPQAAAALVDTACFAAKEHRIHVETSDWVGDGDDHEAVRLLSQLLTGAVNLLRQHVTSRQQAAAAGQGQGQGQQAGSTPAALAAAAAPDAAQPSANGRQGRGRGGSGSGSCCSTTACHSGVVSGPAGGDSSHSSEGGNGRGKDDTTASAAAAAPASGLDGRLRVLCYVAHRALECLLDMGFRMLGDALTKGGYQFHFPPFDATAATAPPSRLFFLPAAAFEWVRMLTQYAGGEGRDGFYRSGASSPCLSNVLPLDADDAAVRCGVPPFAMALLQMTYTTMRAAVFWPTHKALHASAVAAARALQDFAEAYPEAVRSRFGPNQTALLHLLPLERWQAGGLLRALGQQRQQHGDDDATAAGGAVVEAVALLTAGDAPAGSQPASQQPRQLLPGLGTILQLSSAAPTALPTDD